MAPAACPPALAAEETAAATPADAAQAGADPQAELAEEASRLVTQLGADTAAARDAARQSLMALAGKTTASGERLLAALPVPVEQMPAAVRTALAGVRREVAERLAELASAASRVSLDVVAAPLEEVLAEIERQTGNKLKDLREQFGQQAPDRPVTIEIDDAPFWEAVDQVLDEAGLGVYAYAGERAVALIAREPGATPRWAAAAYAGPLRIEATRVTAARNLRRVSGESLAVQLELSWEPRVAPIALSLPLGGVQIENEDGQRLSLAQPERTLDVEVDPGGQTTEMTLPLLLPDRQTSLIASLRGALQAIMPGREAEFRFTGLAAGGPLQQKQGAALVSVEQVRKAGEIWEVRMRLRLDDAEGADATEDVFASHRGWVLSNVTYLEDKEGNRVEHAGFETTMQRGNEIGMAYLFELPSTPAPDGPEDKAGAGPSDGPAAGGIGDYTWVYKTPTAILRVPIEFELNHIPLP
ncbi:MAG: hypothetical protein AAF790_03055 [Planctomycetota bacterium]